MLPAPPECPAVVADAMRYSVMAGGKRLRPILCLASGRRRRPRRRRPAARRWPAGRVRDRADPHLLAHSRRPAGDGRRHAAPRPADAHVVAGEGMAILAGDGLLTEAFALLAREPATTRRDRRRPQAARDRPWSPPRPARRHGRRPGHRPRRRRPRRHSGAASARRRRPRRHARAQDRRADSRRRRWPARSWRGGRRRIVDRDRRLGAASSGSRFRSSTTCSTSKGASADLGKTAGKDAAAGKPTYPALLRPDARRRRDGRRLRSPAPTPRSR